MERVKALSTLHYFFKEGISNSAVLWDHILNRELLSALCPSSLDGIFASASALAYQKAVRLAALTFLWIICS